MQPRLRLELIQRGREFPILLNREPFHAKPSLRVEGRAVVGRAVPKTISDRVASGYVTGDLPSLGQSSSGGSIILFGHGLPPRFAFRLRHYKSSFLRVRTGLTGCELLSDSLGCEALIYLNFWTVNRLHDG